MIWFLFSVSPSGIFHSLSLIGDPDLLVAYQYGTLRSYLPVSWFEGEVHTAGSLPVETRWVFEVAMIISG